MGTSTRWVGPGSRSGTAAEWSRVSRRLSRWNGEGPQAEQLLDKILDDHLDVLHQTMRENQSAFGLVDAATKAGYRLVDAMAALADEGPGGLKDADDFLARFTDEVGGDGRTVTGTVGKVLGLVVEDVLERQEGTEGESA